MIKKIKLLLLKYREVIMYLIFGVLTTAVNWGIYSVFVKYLGVNINISNVIAWIFSVLFAFVTNKIWVFESKSTAPKTVLREFVLFLGARAISGVIEIAGLPIAVKLGLNQSLFGVEAFLAKIIISVVVVVTNYVFSKMLVFKKEKEDKNEV